MLIPFNNNIIPFNNNQKLPYDVWEPPSSEEEPDITNVPDQTSDVESSSEELLDAYLPEEDSNPQNELSMLSYLSHQMNLRRDDLENNDYLEETVREAAWGFFHFQILNKKISEFLQNNNSETDPFGKGMKAYILFYTCLQKKLDLPINPDKAIFTEKREEFASFIGITEEQINFIGDEIIKECTEEEYENFLENWSPFQKYLEDDEEELKRIALGELRLETLDKKITQIAKESTLKEKEVFDIFYFALKEKLDLPVKTQDFIRISDISEQQIHEIGEQVLNECDQQALENFLKSWEPWQDYQAKRLIKENSRFQLRGVPQINIRKDQLVPLKFSMKGKFANSMREKFEKELKLRQNPHIRVSPGLLLKYHPIKKKTRIKGALQIAKREGFLKV